jgi:hypothetical protein
MPSRQRRDGAPLLHTEIDIVCGVNRAGVTTDYRIGH